MTSSILRDQASSSFFTIRPTLMKEVDVSTKVQCGMKGKNVSICT